MTSLSPHQESALRAIVARIKGQIHPEPLSYLAGYAGTGKSTLLPFILDEIGFAPETIAFCAPTGKAAKVMRMKLKAQKYPNFNATTIHSAIYRAKPAPIATLESDIAGHQAKLAGLHNQLAEAPGSPAIKDEIEKQRKLILRLQEELSSAYREDTINFQLNVDSPIQTAQLIVIDEASMVGRRMANDLMTFNVPILAMGDPGQLPPVKDDEGLTAGKPDFFLSEIHRQAEGNPIIHLSMLAREGKNLPFGKYGEEAEVIRRSQFDEVYTDLSTRPQFLVGMNKTRWNTNQMLRKDFGFVYKMGDRVGPMEGEPLVVRKNSRENPNLVNGTSCVATSSWPDLIHGEARLDLSFIDDEDVEYRDRSVYQGLFEEHFSRRLNGFTAHEATAFRAKKNSINMDWDYSRTVHSSQGGQWPDVVLIDESDVFREDADRHLYTGITRAEKTLKILR